jgi:outer membrane protein assembly factor BamE (lipoprotein component of BamABCDE complex)
MRLIKLALLALVAACVSCASAQGKAEKAMAKLQPDMSKEEVAVLLGPPALSSHHGFGFFTWKYEFKDDGYMWDRYGKRHSDHPEARDEDGARPKDPRQRWLMLHFEEGGLTRWETD